MREPTFMFIWMAVPLLGFLAWFEPRMLAYLGVLGAIAAYIVLGGYIATRLPKPNTCERIWSAELEAEIEAELMKQLLKEHGEVNLMNYTKARLEK